MLTLFRHYTAVFLKNCFMRQCNTYATKAQYDRSNVFISEWLRDPLTVYMLDKELVECLQSYQANLMSKEQYLAHHVRVKITMCADAMTTSPVESMNDITKNTMRIGANMNLSTSVIALVEQHGERYERHVNKMLLKMDGTNLASQAPTKHHIHHKCQQMIDTFHDEATHLKCVQVNASEWLCWKFFDPDEKRCNKKKDCLVEGVGIDEDVKCVYEESLRKSMVVPSFLNVYRVRLCTYDSTMFLRCSCRHFERLVRKCCRYSSSSIIFTSDTNAKC